MKLKVCGMNYKNNIQEVALLRPDYLGFIFYEKSSRFFNGEIPTLPDSIKKVGVFVNSSLESIAEKVMTHNLQAVQLHGKESPEFIKELIRMFADSNFSLVEIIKVFSIKDDFDFSVLQPYESLCNYFLFDTKGKLPGGNGYAFNWDILSKYPSSKPYFLSGGIGNSEIENLKQFKATQASKYCYAIDVNSKFEIKPGLKNIFELEQFRTNVASINFRGTKK
ncbi:phosphoribosylanthranilate isomerase [uncultured Psychroserpens sp.]|uniref:phosphoribosylanthranilate isomerase n=1 Tax=uncultured Psychroserpens sp. TaxID=255436 RepID=UPI002625D9A3|nr:phosphoribosylanthranilate isomerase [uncultured Psychroserpens sp.]